MNLDPSRLESTDEGLLPRALVRVPWRVSHECGAVVNLGDLVPRERELAHAADVQPLVRRAANGAVVEVEAVDVDVGAHARLTLRQPMSRPRNR